MPRPRRSTDLTRPVSIHLTPNEIEALDTARGTKSRGVFLSNLIRELVAGQEDALPVDHVWIYDLTGANVCKTCRLPKLATSTPRYCPVNF